MLASELLKEAQAELARRGLWQGWFMPSAEKNGTLDPAEDTNPATCRVCMAGAIFFVAYGHPVPKTSVVMDQTAFGAMDVLYNVTVPDGPKDWNDAPGRTLSECVVKFDEAILLAREWEASGRPE